MLRRGHGYYLVSDWCLKAHMSIPEYNVKQPAEATTETNFGRKLESGMLGSYETSVEVGDFGSHRVGSDRLCRYFLPNCHGYH